MAPTLHRGEGQAGGGGAQVSECKKIGGLDGVSTIRSSKVATVAGGQ